MHTATSPRAPRVLPSDVPGAIPGPPPTARRAPTSPGRLVLALLAAVLVGLVLPLLVGPPVDANPTVVPSVGVVSVRPGETLWDIAAAHAAPGQDVRGLVAAIKRANDLDGAPLQAWQRLRIPRVPGG